MKAFGCRDGIPEKATKHHSCLRSQGVVLTFETTAIVLSGDCLVHGRQCSESKVHVHKKVVCCDH